MDKIALASTLLGSAIIGGVVVYSLAQNKETHSIITLQGTNAYGIEQILTFDHQSCHYSDSKGVVIDGNVTAVQVEEACMLGMSENLSEKEFTCAFELCKNTP
jgi:hypothetical protein